MHRVLREYERVWILWKSCGNLFIGELNQTFWAEMIECWDCQVHPLNVDIYIYNQIERNSNMSHEVCVHVIYTWAEENLSEYARVNNFESMFKSHLICATHYHTSINLLMPQKCLFGCTHARSLAFALFALFLLPMRQHCRRTFHFSWIPC